MSKEQKDSHLHYGQGLLIKGFTSNQDDVGLLTAKGFADTSAKYETFKDILYFKNYRNAIFQIIPASNFQINDELRKLQEMNSEENANYKILVARAKSEQEQFELKIKNKDKSFVCFGDTVIFRHVDSETFLSGTIRPSEGLNGAFTVEVTKMLKERLIFQVLPFRSYEKIGMPIPFDSPVKLLNIYNNGYLTFEKIGIKAKNNQGIDFDKKPIVAGDSYVIPVKTNSSESVIYESVTHFMDLSKQSEDPMPWIFQLHMKEVENDSLIQHDIIYFQHTQNNGILSTQGKEIILKEMKEEQGEELPFYQCLWQVQKHDATEHSYILRHLMSGMTLGIKKDSLGNPTKAQLFDISEGLTEGNLGFVQLKLAKKEIADIKSDAYINIAYNDWCLDKNKQELILEGEDEDLKSKDYISIPRLNKLANAELEYEVKQIKFTTEISKNCFVIKEIKDDLKRQVLFALSFHSKIIELREDLKWGYQESSQKIEYIRMMQVTEKIKQIKDFLKNCSKEESDLEYIRPIYKRQMICKDLGISELLFELLFYMSKNLEGKKIKVAKDQPKVPFIFHDKPNELQKFIELYNTIYQVIYELIRDNLTFKIYVSKWINFVIEDVITDNQPNHLKLLKQIFKNNEFLIKNFVDETLVSRLSTKMLEQKDSFLFVQIKYLSIFRLFCIVGDTINTNNQIAVLNKFIRELKVTETSIYYQINLSKQNTQVFTEAAIDKNQLKKRRFGDYFKICKEQYSTAWQYFVEYLNLIADMTKGRNKQVQDNIQSMFSLDILTDLLMNYQLQQAEAPIIRLIHNLYIESEFYYAIEKKKRISDYQSLKTEVIDVMTTTSQGKPWNSASMMKVLNCLMEKLRKIKSINPKEVQTNSNLYQILSLIWQTLNLGFWEKKELVKDILNEVLRVLEPHPSIIQDYAQASIESKQNSLMIKCKQQCMKIILTVLDYDIDLTVRSLCKYFQAFELPAKTRKLKNDEGARMLEFRVDNELAVKFINGIPKDIKMNIVDLSILSKMIEISKYNNPVLTSGSISVMERVLLKNKKAISNFCQQIFVCSKGRIALKGFIEEKKNKFQTLQDQTLVKMITPQEKADNYVAIFKQDPINTGIMQDLYMMSEVIKNQANVEEIKGLKTLQSSGINSKLGEDVLINFTDERTSSNMMKQSVLDAENVHLKVLEFVLNCTQIPPPKSYALKLLHLCYKFLVSLIWNNQNIKPTLICYLPYIQHHLRKNVGSIDFLKEMYDNSKTLLFNQVNCQKLIKEICNTINSEPQTSFYKSKLLDFFRFLIYCNNKSLKVNQILILKIMQDDSYTNINLNIDKKMIEDLVKQFKGDTQPKVDGQQVEKREIESKGIQIKPKLLYLITYFQILQSLIDDKCVVNMGKLKKRYPFEQLLKWLAAADTCWPLKRNIRAFLNRLYYFQPEIEVYMKDIVGQELDNIINDLNWYITAKCKINANEIETFMFKNPIRFSYMESYLYLNLQENLFTLYKLATDKIIKEQMQNILHPIDNSANTGPKKFIRICQRLGWIKNYFTECKNVYTNSFIKFLLKQFENVIVEFDDDIFLPGMNLRSDQPRAPMKSEKESARKGLIIKIMKGEIGTFYSVPNEIINQQNPLVYSIPDKISNPKDQKIPDQNKLLKILRNIFKRQKRQFQNLDEQVDYKMGRLVRAIKLSKEGEQILFTDYNKNLNSYSQNTQIFDYITIIIEMNTKNPDALGVKEKKFFLNFITGIVDQNNHCPREFKTIDQWEAADWIDSREQIIDIQNSLKTRKLGEFITELLKQNIWENIQFADSVLLCGIAYLFGGNTATQKNMIQTIRLDSQNKVMRNIECLISKLGQFIVKNIQQSSRNESQQKDHFSVTTIDNYDFYDSHKKFVTRKNVFEAETTDEQIYTKTCIRCYKRAFKFLQLLCENNNIEGKNFIREQGLGVKEYDFIKIAAKEVRNLFLSLTTQLCPVSMFLLDFIQETTQIPVKQNQQALMNLTFFEDVCALYTNMNKPNVLSLKGFDGREDQIDKIYEKAIQIILSNFEGNDINTFRAVDNKLQPKFLISNLISKLQKIGLKSKEDAIQYIDRITTCEFDEDMMIVLNIIIIFKKLKEKLKDNCRVYPTYQKEKGKNPELFEFLEKNLLEIEIINGGMEQSIIFPKYPVFNSLTGNLRDTVMASVSRSTHRDKIVSLLGYTSAIKNKIESTYTLLKTEKISEKLMNDAFNISAIMSIVLCVYMMMFYNVIINYGEADFDSSRVISLGRFSLSLIQLSMSLVYAYYWLKFKIWQQPQRKARGGQAAKPQIPEGPSQENKYVTLIKAKISMIIKKLKLDEILGLIHGIIKGGETTQPLYLSAQFWRVALYVIVSFVGAFFYPPLYFIHIMDIFCYNPQIGNIFRAIGLNIFQLFYVSVMGVVFTFVFCTVTFSNYQKNVYTGQESEEQLCQTMMDCIFQLYVSGAIGQTMESFEIVRFTYDTIYGIFFGIMFSNIISGIMLDAFGSLRDLTNQLQKDKENKCYICDIDRETLEKRRISFKQHISGKHFLWNYVFFIYYLDKKNPTEYSGLEYQITNQYNKSDEEMQIFWVPMAVQEEFDCKGKLEELNAVVDQKVQLLAQNSATIEESLLKFKELIEG